MNNKIRYFLTLTSYFLFCASSAFAGLWEGLTDENYISGPKITERAILGKVVLVHVIDTSEFGLRNADRVEAFYKSYDKNRFIVVGSWPKAKDGAVEAMAATKKKFSYPIYKDFKLVSDKEKRLSGAAYAVNPFGKIVVGTGEHAGISPDFEQILVETITMVGAAPNIAPGVTLEKYKSLKTKLKLGVNLKSVIKQLEKDVAAAEKKTATAQIKAKAEEASAILSAIKDGKAEIYENANALADVNPVAALDLLTKYLKSFPDENADNKEKLAELKAKAAEFKKQK